MSILGQQGLIKKGKELIYPFDVFRFGSKRPNECCYDLALASLAENEEDLSDRLAETYTMKPNEFILGLTEEEVRLPDNMFGILSTRSYYAKRGINLSNSCFIKPGWRGKIVLEIKNVHHEKLIAIQPQALIATIVFLEVSSISDIANNSGAEFLSGAF